MIRMRAAGTSLLSMLLLAACVSMPHVHSEEFVPVVDSGCSVDSSLAEVHEAGTMSPLQRSALLADMEQDFLGEPNVENRLRLALLLATGEENGQQRAQAYNLIEGIATAQEDATSSQQGLAELLAGMLERQQRMGEQLVGWEDRVKQQDTRINELEQQLKELTSIEQNIQHRDLPVGEEDDR